MKTIEAKPCSPQPTALRPSLAIRFSVWLAAASGAAFLLVGLSALLFAPPACAQSVPLPKSGQAAVAPVDPPTVNDRLPDQSHEMQDAAYHFENLWFAGDKQNWQLADYYLRKTRSYLALAVRIKPVRQTSAGTPVDLRIFLSAVDQGMLSQIDTAIAHQDVAGFRSAYRQSIQGCEACHTTCDRAYIRLQVPSVPSAALLNFDPPSIPGH